MRYAKMEKIIFERENELEKFKQQRDELLTAMKNMRPFIEEGDVPERFWSESFKTALSDFDAAIAKCET